MIPDTSKQPPSQGKYSRVWIFGLLLIVVLFTGAYFRVTGIFWGENQFLHPDERFLVWVGTDISPVESLGEYFDTPNSSLNPHNRGHGFYVYGTLPMFLTRYIVQWVFGHSGFAEMTQVGRVLSALVDLLTVLLVYLVASRLYDRRAALLASAFSAAAVLQIQLSHYFTMDTFIVFFSFLAFYFAVLIATDTRTWSSIANQPIDLEHAPERVHNHIWKRIKNFTQHPLFLPALGFGLAFGMAVASKLNAAPMALVLPAAITIRLIRFPGEERYQRGMQAFWYLVLAGVISVITFRILQPYAFSGPSFFGLKPNPQWLANIRELLAQSSGDVDFPPAMQWARRSVLFSSKNLVLWGLGLPLGILAGLGFLWAGWRMVVSVLQRTNEWQQHALLWGWTAAYFAWQSLSLTPSMRYQLPVYPALVIFASWGLVTLYDRVRSRSFPASGEKGAGSECGSSRWFARGLVVLFGVAVLGATLAYAFGFTRIYDRPITRIEASRWIYQNIPGAINLRIQTDEEITNQPLPFPYDFTITPGLPYRKEFVPKTGGILSEVYLPHVQDLLDSRLDNRPNSLDEKTLKLTINPAAGTGDHTTSSAEVRSSFTPPGNTAGEGYKFNLDQPLMLDPDRSYELTLELAGETAVISTSSEVALGIHPVDASSAEELSEQQLHTSEAVLNYSSPLSFQFVPETNGVLKQIRLPQTDDQENGYVPASFLLSLTEVDDEFTVLSSSVSVKRDPRDGGYLLLLDQPISLTKVREYILDLQLTAAGGAISISGAGFANEGEWDDGLPLRLDGYDGFAGIYPLDLNFNMYWEDNPQKMARFSRILDQSEYLLISSSRQWGSLPRIPERFPMTAIYYRTLLGCPLDRSIEWCYNVAKPGMFQGDLGFELVEVFQSDPSIGPLKLNDQFAEEAFTVYDHPKVFVFKKNEDYDPQVVQDVLGSVDFSQVTQIPPMKFPLQPDNLMLHDYRLAEQRQGGTWSELFDTSALQNRYQLLSVIIWYLSISLLGFITYPVLRIALPGLADGGYPLARTTGLLILSYLVWLAGSFRVPFSRPTITAALVGMTVVGAILAYRQRDELYREIKKKPRYFLIIEILTLLFFISFLLVRFGNPDLWHPWKGGEKPMDFSYFNAVLKSTSFPPYDPWYAGGYLNYYYYGFVLVGVLVKWLGIVPAVAYNLILPTLFSMIALGAFSLGWNLFCSRPKVNDNSVYEDNLVGDLYSSSVSAKTPHPFWIGLAGALSMAVLGNLGTVRMIVQGYQKIVAPGGVLEGANLLTRFTWTLRGFILSLQGASLPYGIGDWYWLPSRIIPAGGDIEPITEFPNFTLLYADLHAHLLALPIALLVLSICLSFVLGRVRWKGVLGFTASFLLAGLAIGALRPTNTADFYPYLALSVVILGYSIWFYQRSSDKKYQNFPLLAKLPDLVRRMIITLVGIMLLVLLTYLLYLPYTQWSAFGYGKLDLWKGSHTPLHAYLTHWGLFLFVILSWMIWETINWMAATPVSALRKLVPYKGLILGGILLLGAVILGLTFTEVGIAWFVLPIATWAGILILRPKMPDSKRFVLFLVGTGLILTLAVESIVVVGDIGRMNTVFKFYLQVWTLFAVSAAAALGWVLSALVNWSPGWRRSWQVVLIVLLIGTALYPMMATMAKIKDRMAPTAPHTLDGSVYMKHARYRDSWGEMDLSQDYRAIRWLQENVSGSPVIVEANLRTLYRWGSRYSIYTGLPGVVGWEWHQQQQRTAVPGIWVSERITEINEFYNTKDLEAARSFLRKYDVQYIIVGQQERGHYPGLGLDKFEAAEGILWHEVYRDDETVIYKVIV
ncbi:DUF2298 domain-containing protein [Chloroflexota bacterium]